MKFLDKARIQVASGRGGSGISSFRRESRVPHGGPDGGNGGRGGHLIFKTDPKLSSLLPFHHKRNYSAENGVNGGRNFRTGAQGKDLIVSIPPGTIIYDSEGRKLYDLEKEEEFMFLKGGRGGKGNSFFKSSVNQAPMYSQKGEEGIKKEIDLELKIIADVGIIGLPNAGKSTLLSRISKAKAKAAPYPFTTLIPQLGVVPSSKNQSFLAVDIPGIIEGAHKGKGLGIHFLRHIERTRLLIHMIDISEDELLTLTKEKSKEKRIWNHYSLIQNELTKYEKILSQKEKRRKKNSPMTQKTQIVTLSKSETVSKKVLKKLLFFFEKKGIKVLPISSVTGKNIDQLIFKAKELLQ